MRIINNYRKLSIMIGLVLINEKNGMWIYYSDVFYGRTKVVEKLGAELTDMDEHCHYWPRK